MIFICDKLEDGSAIHTPFYKHARGILKDLIFFASNMGNVHLTKIVRDIWILIGFSEGLVVLVLLLLKYVFILKLLWINNHLTLISEFLLLDYVALQLIRVHMFGKFLFF